MSVTHYRRLLKLEQDRALRYQKEIADLSSKVVRLNQNLSGAQTTSQLRNYQRQIDQRSKQRAQLQTKLADSQKKIANYTEQLNKAEQREQTAEAKKREKQAREQQRAHAALERQVSTTSTTLSELSSRVSSIEDTLLANVHDAVIADPVERQHDIFLSHAGPDSELAAHLYEELTARGLDVWFDGATLELGKSLARQIDRGIAKSRAGIILITMEFLKGRKWTEREIGGLLTGRRRLIPILDGVDFEDLEAYSPMLADFVGLSTDNAGLDEIAERIAKALARKPSEEEYDDAVSS